MLCNSDSGVGSSDLVLYGAATIKLELVSFQTDSSSEWQLIRDKQYKISPDDSSLTIKTSLLPEESGKSLYIIIVSYINPPLNKESSELYKLGQILCTQMEDEVFQTMTYCLDHPDAISTCKVRQKVYRFSYLLIFDYLSCLRFILRF